MPTWIRSIFFTQTDFRFKVEASINKSLHMFRRSNSRELFFLHKETNSKETAIVNMEIVTNFEVVKVRVADCRLGKPIIVHLYSNAWL